MAKKKSQPKKRKIAIVTYNRIGEGEYPNGMTDGKGVQLFVAQNGHKNKWGADPDLDSAAKERIRRSTATHVMGSLELTDMDHVYVYVGSDGSEEAIRLTHDLPGEKVTYVMCNCNWSRKMHMISNIGNRDAEKISCECGGRRTLARIARRVLNHAVA